MLLIDSSNINAGGGVSLLLYLIESLEKKGIQYHVLSDIRWKTNSINPAYQSIVHVNIFNRKERLQEVIEHVRPSCILFFGNFPPPFKVAQDIPVFTYIQNTMVINWDYTKYLNFKTRLYVLATQVYLRLNLKNCSNYIFQNNIVRSDFIKSYGFNKNNSYLVLPFFKLDHNFEIIPFVQKEEAFIYVSSDLRHKNHINLLKSWEILLRQSIKPKLYLTIDEHTDSEVVVYFRKLVAEGANISSLGIISHNEVLEKCNTIKFSIFPSFTETIGLGLVESVAVGCKVLAPDLDYVKEVIEPSLLFDPKDSNSIAKSVEYALNNHIQDSSIIIRDKIDDLISLLS
jgi:glycosyltransferase involved in cell wall biosynthesis